MSETNFTDSSSNIDKNEDTVLNDIIIENKDIAVEAESTVEVVESKDLVDDVKEETLELVSETILEPVVEVKPENVIDAVVKPEPVVESTPKVANTDNKVAIYALRTLTLPSGTIPKGYSYISKSQYEKIANHKAVRLATKAEIASNL